MEVKIDIPHYGKDKPYLGREDDFQETAYRWIKSYQHKDALAYHSPNGGKRNGREAAKFKRMGVVPGVCDLLIDEPRNDYHGLRIELKVKGGRLTDYQRKFLTDSQARGYYVAVCWSLDGFIECVNQYLK